MRDRELVVEPARRVDAAWWPFLRKRAALFDMAESLRRRAERHAAEAAAGGVYHVDDYLPPAADAAELAGVDHAPALRAVIADIVDRGGGPAQIRFRKLGTRSHYRLAFTRTDGAGADRAQHAWIPPTLSGIDIVLEDGVTLHAETRQPRHAMLQLGPVVDDRSQQKLFECFAQPYQADDYWRSPDPTSAGKTLESWAYDIAGQHGRTTFTLPAGTHRIELVSGGEDFVPGDRIAICWEQLLANDAGPRAAQPLVHHARVTDVDGNSIEFWPGLWAEASVRPFRRDHNWFGSHRPITVHQFAPYAIEGFGLRGEGKARIISHVQNALIRGGTAVYGLFVRNIEILDRVNGMVFNGMALNDVYISDIAYTSVIETERVRRDIGNWLIALDKGAHRIFVENITALDGIPSQTQHYLHVHEGVRDVLIYNTDFFVDDTSEELLTYLRDQKTFGIHVVARNDSVWIENFRFRYASGANRNRGPIIKIGTDTSGTCGLILCDARGTEHHFTAGAGYKSRYPGRTAYRDVRSDFRSAAAHVINGNIFGGSASHAETIVKLSG